jgi:serine/threonine protein phosphatase PrpC
MFAGFQAITRGESHKEKDLPCQDAVLHKPYPNGGIIAVADGHGSEKHFRSDVGSACAVEIAVNTISEFNKLLKETESRNKGIVKVKRLISRSPSEAQIKKLEGSIITRWRSAVLEHFCENPLNEAERELCSKLKLDGAEAHTQVRFYGTTLLAALLKKEFWFVLQIGDGKCVIIDAQGKARFPGIDDEALGFGKTTSLCDSNAAENFREIYGTTPIKGITLATDGVTDSFIPDAYLEFHEKLYVDFCRDTKRASGGVEKGISVWSANGSRDDAAMAGIFEIEEITMNINSADITKRIIAEQDEDKDAKNAHTKAVKMRFAEKLKSANEKERPFTKEYLAQQLHEKAHFDLALCNKTLDTLCATLFNDQASEAPKERKMNNNLFDVLQQMVKSNP